MNASAASTLSTETDPTAGAETQAASVSGLPNVAYIADVPIEKSVGGMLLLYRLFEHYPPGRFLVMQQVESKPELRLPGVVYQRLFKRLYRPMQSRYRSIAGGLLLLSSGILGWAIARRLRGSSVEAVVTVSHSVSWAVAANVARRLRVPLHIINHDYWPETLVLPGVARGWADQRFAQVYRAATLRLCVSPGMEEHYRREYGVPGTVLYPGRGRTAQPERPTAGKSGSVFTIGYAGSLQAEGFATVLQTVAGALEQIGGQLIVFSPNSEASIRARGLVNRNVVFAGQKPVSEIIQCLRETSDALILPMSAGMGLNVTLSFPSKLVDYTVTGLPIIIVGPPSCSAVRWAAERGAGIVVNENDEPAIARAVQSLAQDPKLRRAMGERLRQAGDEDFSYEATAGKLFSELRHVGPKRAELQARTQ